MRVLQRLMIVLGAAGLVACGGSSAETETETTPVAVQDEPAPEPEPVEAPVMEDPDDVRIVGDHLEIDGRIQFATDSDELLDDSTPLLEHIAQLLGNHADEISHLQIVGHTDAAGGHDHNQDLSERRAAAVAAALQERGVTATLDHSGVGETEPTCEEDTDECHAANRRVEFLIVQD